MNLYLTIAPPASKKTTMCRTIKDCVLITVDDFRLAFYKEPYNENKEEYLKQIIANIIFALHKNPNINIILDESKWLINKESRSYWIDLGKKLGFKIIALKFNKSLEFCLKNNEQRKGNRVPENVLVDLYHDLEKPELSEGFDDIIEIDKDNSSIIYLSQKEFDDYIGR